jgi:hypothetical protein
MTFRLQLDDFKSSTTTTALSAQASAMPPKRAQWRSIVLRPGIVALLLSAELILISTIIALWILSDVHNGFVNVGFRGSGSTVFSMQGAFDYGQPLLWTTLPIVILTLYRLFREAVVDSLVVEIPFMELYKSSSARPTTVRKSIYLDYRTSFTIIAWAKALKNKHTFLGLCMLFSFVVSIALVPLAGGLFIEGGELSVTNATFDLLSTLNTTTDITIVDYGRLFDVVSASWVYTAPYPSRTEGRFPLPKIAPVQDLKNYTISLPVTTSQLSLDCQVIRDATFTTTTETENIALRAFSAVDRDCAISGDVAIGDRNAYFLGVSTHQDCPDVAGRTRMVLFFVPVASSSDVQDQTLISCIPSYWTVNGTVNVIRRTDLAGEVTETPSFSEISRVIEELPGFKRQQFEQGVVSVQSINVGSNVNAPDRLGELVARYIDSKGLNLTEGSLITAASTVYPAIYTMLSLNYFFPESAQRVEQEGVLRIPENRLHTVEPVAIAMLLILAILILESIYLIIYLHKHPSILAEEPIGLVGAANLLHGSNISSLVANFHQDPEFDGRLRRPVEQANTPGEKTKVVNTDDGILDGECWIERELKSAQLKIEVRPKAGGVERAQPFLEPAFFEHQSIPATYAAQALQYPNGQRPSNAALLV